MQKIDPAAPVEDDTVPQAFEKLYDELQMELERESFDPTPHLARMEGVIASFLRAGDCTLSHEHQTFFLRQGLPNVVRILTGRRRSKGDNDDQFLRTNEFFTRVLDLIIALMPKDIAELLETLNRLFDDACACYNRPRDEKEKHTTKRASKLLVEHNINFVNKRGLDAMVARASTEPRLSVPLLKLHIVAWSKVGKFLNQAHLDAMWKAAATQHAEPAVYAVLGGAIASNLSPELQSYLLQLIHSTPFAEYTLHTIDLIAQFQSSTEIRLRALNLLWQIVQDDSKMDQPIADAALDRLCEVLATHDMQAQRIMLIQCLCDHIRNRVSVHQSIVLLQRVLQEHYHDDKEMKEAWGTDNSRQKVINELKVEIGLVDLLFRELVLYKQACVCRRAEILSSAAAAGTGDERSAGVNWNSVALEGRFPHLTQVLARLEFIRFVLDFSFARLTRDRADIMWECLVLNSMSRAEVEAALGWFHRICESFSKEKYNTITCVMVENLFEHRLCKLDMASLSGPAFDCLRRYFCCLNSQNQSLRMDGPMDDFLVLRFDGLIGLDPLWNVALGSSEEAVFEESVALLVALHQKVGDARQHITACKSFVDRCVERLQLAHQQISVRENVASAQNQIDRLIFMLKSFLQESKARNEEKKEVGTSPVIVRLAAAPPKNTPQVRKGKEQDIAFLQEMNPGLSTVAAVVAMERNYYSMDLALSALMDDRSKDAIMAEAAKYEAVEEQPATSLADVLSANQALFELLFELLCLDGVDRVRVWEVVMELPTNPVIEHTLTTLQSPNWDELINARSLHKTLYCLQVVDRLLLRRGDKDTEAQTKEKHKLCKRFFHCGGFHHILDLLLRDDFHVNQVGGGGGAFKSCLRLLLKIICFFVQVADLTMLPGLADDGEEKNGRRSSLSTNTGRALIATVDFPEVFLGTMLGIILDTCKGHPPHSDDDDVQIVEYAMQLLVSSIVSKPAHLKSFYECGLADKERKGMPAVVSAEMTPIEDFIINVTLAHNEQQVRKAASASFYLLCSQYPDEFAVAEGLVPPQRFFLDLLLRRIPSDGSACDQFFALLSLLVERHFKKERPPNNAEVFSKFERLLCSTIDRIKSHRVQDAISRDDPPDQLLIGLFNIVRTLARLAIAAKIRRENERLDKKAYRATEVDEAIESERRELDELVARTRRELEDAREWVRLEAEDFAAQRALQAAEHERIKEARVELDVKRKEAQELASELESRKAAADELRARLEEAETELAADRDQLEEERQALATEKLKMSGIQEFTSRRVKLNIGGGYFQTSLTTLTQVPSMFSAMFSGKYLMETDEEGCYFIDRDPTHFRYVLNFLRDSRVEVPTTEGNESFVRELLAEAEFYQVEGLISLLSDILGGASADGRGFSPRSPSTSSSSSSAFPFSGSSTAKRSGSGASGASTVPSTTTRIHTRPTMP